MTLTVEFPTQLESTSYEGGYLPDASDRSVGEDVRPDSLHGHRSCQSFNADRVGMLLEEPAIALWAMEAASRYQVTKVDALELLAYALFLDGER